MEKIDGKILILTLLTFFFVLGLVIPTMGYTATSPLLVGSIDYSILGGTTVTCTGGTTVTGNVGVTPGTSITGFPSPCTVSPGTIQSNTPSAISAQADNLSAFGLLDAGTNADVNCIGGVLPDGTDLTAISPLGPGLYCSAGEFRLTGNLSLTGTSGVWVFKTVSGLTTSSGSSITGGSACDIWWRVGSSVILDTTTIFKGNILAHTSISLLSGATLTGRAFAYTGAVTLDANAISGCVNPIIIPPTPTSTPPSILPINTGSGWSAPLPLINVTKIPSPLNLPTGPGPVTYTYVVTNVGIVPMSSVWTRDDKCTPVTFISGDINNDSMLDVTESWTYRCTKTVSQTETNTVTAHGWSNGADGYDTANATVVVGDVLIPPLIHLVKVPNVFVLPAVGGAVTYTYIVTNPGVVPLSNVGITDDKCTGLPVRVTGHPGDINKNDLLESDEVWSFTCQSNLTQTTTNIGRVEGSANGFTISDLSSATVVVSPPSFPSTGFGPNDEKNTPWMIVALVGTLVAVLIAHLILKSRMI